jgi:hypothetical protein
MTLRSIVPRLLLGLAVVVGASLLALNRNSLDPALIKAALRSLGSWGPAAHVALLALASVLFAPGALFAPAGGVLFGPLGENHPQPCERHARRHGGLPDRALRGSDGVRQKADARLDRLVWFPRRREPTRCAPARSWSKQACTLSCLPPCQYSRLARPA